MSATAIDVHDFINALYDAVRRLDLPHVDDRDQAMHIAADTGDVDELARLVRVLRSSTLRELSFAIEDIEPFDPVRATVLRQHWTSSACRSTPPSPRRRRTTRAAYALVSPMGPMPHVPDVTVNPPTLRGM
jgi:hypothetical protein